MNDLTLADNPILTTPTGPLTGQASAAVQVNPQADPTIDELCRMLARIMVRAAAEEQTPVEVRA